MPKRPPDDSKKDNEDGTIAQDDPVTPTNDRRFWFVDSEYRPFRQACALLLLFFLSSWVGMTYVATYGQNGIYFQQYYGPAVMVASGRGFVNPVISASPALRDFLELRTRSLDVRELPASLPTSSVTQLQARWLYMLYVVGTLWRIFGVSWDALLPLFGALCGFTTLAIYAIFWLVSGRRVALLAAVFLTMSPFNLLFLPDLRDYSKAPFILGCIACLGALVKLDMPWKKQLLILFSLGILLGFGLGFRKDVIICIPPTLLICVALLPGNPITQWKKRLLLITVFIFSFTITAWPLLSAMREKGGTTAHVLILGLTEPFDKSLGIGGAPYTFGQEYQDAYVYSQVKGYWQRHGDGTDIPYATPAYDEACRIVHQYFLRHFPADMLTRWYAATERILNYGPFLTENWSETARNPLIESLFIWRWKWFYWMSGWGVSLAICTALFLGALRLQYGLAYIFLVVYFTGYSSLQFQHRHHFHLEFFWWWPMFLCIGLLCQTSTRAGLKRLLYRDESLRNILKRNFWPYGFARVLLIGAVLGAITVVPIKATRYLQHNIVNRLYDRFSEFTLEPLQAETLDLGAMSGLRPTNFARTPSAEFQDSDRIDEEYLVIEFDASERIVFWTEYDPKFNNYASRVEIEPAKGEDKTVRYFLPVFQASSQNWYMATFLHLAIPSRHMPQFKGMYRVKNLNDVDVLMPMTLYADRTEMNNSYQHKSYMKPLYPRALYAARNNIVANGGFEVWIDDNTPVGFDPPVGQVSVRRSTEFKSSGRSSAKLTWQTETGPTSIFSRFRTKPLKLEPGSTYEFFLDCYNPSDCDILVGVWEISGTLHGILETNRISPAVVQFSRGLGFVKAVGQFTTSQNESATVVLTVAQTGDAYPSEAYLDNFSLVRVE
jgi:hypothetical protein